MFECLIQQIYLLYKLFMRIEERLNLGSKGCSCMRMEITELMCCRGQSRKGGTKC